MIRLPVTCYCGELVDRGSVLDPAYECEEGHYFTRPEADDSNLCPDCSKRGRRIGTACPACRELLPEGVHLLTGSSSVRCGAPMRSVDAPGGWDLGTASVELRDVTCLSCRPPA